MCVCVCVSYICVNICVCMYIGMHVYLYIYIQTCLEVQYKFYFKCIKGIFLQESYKTYNSKYSLQHMTFQQIPKICNTDSSLNSLARETVSFYHHSQFNILPQSPPLVKSTQLITCIIIQGGKTLSELQNKNLFKYFMRIAQ